MKNIKEYAIVAFSLIACAAGVWAMVSEGPTSPGGAALVIGMTGLAFWWAGWFK